MFGGCKRAQVNALQGVPAVVAATLAERGQARKVAAISRHGVRAHAFLECEMRQEFLDAPALARVHVPISPDSSVSRA
jgi:hypothetical protein